MPISDPKSVATAIREYMSRQGIDRYRFADKVRLSKSTIDKVLTGIITEKALARIEKNTGIRFGPSTAVVEFAAQDLGSYTKAESHRYVGTYIFCRLTSPEPRRIALYPFEMSWDDKRPGIVLSQLETGDAVPPQFGFLAIPRMSSYVFVHSNENGWMNLAMVSQLDHTRRLRGVLMATGNLLGNVFAPIISPVVLQKVEREELSPPRLLSDDDPDYGQWKSELAQVVERQYVRILSLERGTVGP
jgi:hypothetical protein